MLWFIDYELLLTTLTASSKQPPTIPHSKHKTPILKPPLRERKMRANLFAQTFWTPPGVRDIPVKLPGHPRLLSSKPKEDKFSREGTNFSATTPSRGRPPPHRAVSGPKKLISVLFSFLTHTLTVVANMSTELTRFAPTICICNGN